MRRVGPHLDPAWAAFLFDGQAQDARTRAGGATQHTRLSYDTRDPTPNGAALRLRRAAAPERNKAT
jgi:hypothetical protein